jgi:hypothetical protein
VLHFNILSGYSGKSEVKIIKNLVCFTNPDFMFYAAFTGLFAGFLLIGIKQQKPYAK